MKQTRKKIVAEAQKECEEKRIEYEDEVRTYNVIQRNTILLIPASISPDYFGQSKHHNACDKCST